MIIFSPAKEMKLDGVREEDWTLSGPSQPVIQAYGDQSPQDLGKLLKIKVPLLEKVLTYRQTWDLPQTYTALKLYNGLAYRTMGLRDYSPSQVDYGQKQVRILSALYGALAPFEGIKPYRLDMTHSLKVQGKSLTSYWKEVWAREFPPGMTIWNFASQEFSSCFSKEAYDWLDVSFHAWKEGQVLSHSTLSKKGRGLLLQYCLLHQVVQKEDLKAFDLGGFRWNPDLSDPHTFVFIQK